MDCFIWMDGLSHAYPIWGFPGGSDSKESTCNAGDLGSIPGSGRSPAGEHGNLLQYSCLENIAMDTGYSPWGCGEADTTEATKHSTDQ